MPDVVFADYIFIYQDNDDPGIDYTVNNPPWAYLQLQPHLTGVARWLFSGRTPSGETISPESPAT